MNNTPRFGAGPGPGGPVFVIGAPRSGTTALARALGHHPELWASAETKFLPSLLGRRPVRVWDQEQQRRAPSWLAREGVDRAEFMAAVGAGLDALFSSRAAGRRWIDHTPHNTVMADVLAELFPAAHFVHIVRDGRRAVHSMRHFADRFDEAHRAALAAELPPAVGDHAEACEVWARLAGAGADLAADLPDRCLGVRNEVLAADPREGFATILEFLGARPDGGPARWFAANRPNSSFPGGPGRPDPWQEWSPAERGSFRTIAGPTMVRLGLATEGEMAER